jgi:hypothetical protein
MVSPASLARSRFDGTPVCAWSLLDGCTHLTRSQFDGTPVFVLADASQVVAARCLMVAATDEAYPYYLVGVLFVGDHAWEMRVS